MSPKPWSRMAAAALGEALLLLALAWGITRQVAAVNLAVAAISDLKDPSPFRVALLGHLGKIHLALQGCLRSSDPALEKQIEESRKEFDASLPEFERENPKLFPASASSEIRQTFAALKESIDHTLGVNRRRMQQRAALDQNFAQMLTWIEKDIRPLIRKTQADGDERSEAALNIENQLRAWQQNLASAWAQPSEAAKELTFENDNRGATYLELYRRLELLPRERKVERLVQGLWQKTGDLARESFAMENVVSQSQKATDVERQQVMAALNRYLPAMPPSELEAKKQAILGSIRLRLAAACLLGLFGLVSLVAAVLALYRLGHRPAPAADGLFRTGGPGPGEKATLQMDLKGTITAWSAAAAELYGYSADEMVGQSIGRLFESESEIGRLYHQLQVAHQTAFETVQQTKAGASVRVRIEFRPISGPDGHAAGIALLCARQ